MLNVYIILFIVIWLILTIVNLFIGEKQTNLPDSIGHLGVSLIISTIPGATNAIAEIITQMLNIKIQTIQNVYVWWGFGFILIIMGIFLRNNIKDRVFILNMFGIFSQLEISDAQNVKDLKISDFKVKEIIIDFVDCFKNGINNDSNKLIVKKIENKCNKFTDRSKDFKSCYTGMGPIPYTILAGTHLVNSKVERYFEYKRSEGKYYEIKDKIIKSKQYPELKEEFPQNKKIDSKEVVVSISITRKIQDYDLIQFKSKDTIKIYVDNPQDNLIVSKKQLYNYRTKIINCLEKIKDEYNQIETILLVASIPSCVSLEIGKMIALNGNRIPEVISYHYNQSGIPKYPFGLIITENPFNNRKGELVQVN